MLQPIEMQVTEQHEGKVAAGGGRRIRKQRGAGTKARGAQEVASGEGGHGASVSRAMRKRNAAPEMN